MKKCGKNCGICPLVKEGRFLKGKNFKWNISKSVNCDTFHCIYLIECNIDRCRQKYIGETDRKLKTRILEHKRYITNNIINKTTGYHFNLSVNNISNFTVTILEKVEKYDEQYRKQREKYFIKKLNTYYKGLNRMP